MNENLNPFEGWLTGREISSGGAELWELVRADSPEKCVLERIRVPRDPGERERIIAAGGDDAAVRAAFRREARQILDGIKRAAALPDSSALLQCRDHAVRQAPDGTQWEIALQTETAVPLPQIMQARGAMGAEAVRRLGVEMAKGLEQLARAGLVHGGITPWAVRVREDGSFVLALPSGADRSSPFCAPEAAAGGEIGPASDIFSAGRTLQWCLGGGSLPDPVLGLSREACPSEAFRSVLARACAADPAARFQAPESFREALEQAASAPAPEEIPVSAEELIASEMTAPAGAACPRCGAPLEQGALFCTACGAPAEEDVRVAPQPQAPRSAPAWSPGQTQMFSAEEVQRAAERQRGEWSPEHGARSGRRRWLIPVIVIVLLLSAGAGVLAALQPWAREPVPAPDTAKGPDAPDGTVPGEEPGKPGSSEPAQEASQAPDPGSSQEPEETDAPTPVPTEPEVSQYIEVISSGAGRAATLTLYTWRDGEWVTDMSCQAWLGSNGVSSSKTEGDRCTPGGTFDILFYMALSDLDSGLEFYQVRRGDVWVEDSGSEYYNTIQNGTGSWNASSDLYAHFSSGDANASIAFSYNGDCRTPGTVTAHGGSCIYIDGVSESALVPNWGDVRISKGNMLRLLEFLESDRHPTITIK